jgi:hypothetical protein
VDKSWFLYVAFRGGLARLAGFALAAALVWSTAARAEEAYRFHVLNSRSGALAAQYWNPILNWVAQKSGVPLEPPWLPMDALLRSGVNVKVVFTRDHETGLAQLKADTVAAVAVNESSPLGYAAREGFAYRLLWSSEPYNSHAIVASPKVPAAQVSAVRAAFVGMKRDPDGRRILEAGGHLLKSRDAAGFVEATDREYENHRAFYRKTLVQSAH